MTDDENFEITKANLRFCPHGGEELEQHPNNPSAVSCYLHGDFILVWDDGHLIVRWRPNKMAEFYIQGPAKKELVEVKPARILDGPL